MPPIRPPKGKSKHKAAASNSASAKPVSLRDLKWKGVAIPSMALSAGPSDAQGSRDVEGETQDLDWDPFAELDEGADDFMGLQEVSGIGVKFEGNEQTGRRIAFYQTANDEEGDGGKTTSKAPALSKKDGKSRKKNAEKVVEAASAPQQGYDESSEGAACTSIPDDAGQSSAANEEEEEFAGFGDDGDSPVDRSSDAQHTDKEIEDDIPQGVFSMFQSQIEDVEDDADQSAATFADVTFDDSRLRSWPKAVLNKLHPILKHALAQVKFTKPTPIQSASLPKILPSLQTPLSQETDETTRARDVVALAQTGSGKTLAYALPILQKVLSSRSSIYAQEGKARPLQALIVLPTRELALQVHEVFQKLVTAAAADTNGKHWVRIAPVVGGMSEERQWRLLRGRSTGTGSGASGKDAEIIIATVGRLWELCRSDDYLPNRLADAETLVLDEADRLLETGKFQELANILDLLQNSCRQTLMFSATLDPTLQVNLSKSRAKVARAMKRSKEQDKMAKLMDRVGFKDPQGAELVDLTKKAMLSDSLEEGKIECLEKEKDLYLYYLLLRYPGSTLAFFNSIDSVRRLQPLLSNLQIQAFSLHGEMDQKARLKALDGFKKSLAKTEQTGTATVLLATDVAARGLDIPSVQHVVHFHLPRSTDTYIHRSGRTARAGRSGLSLILLSPNEKTLWASLRKNLSREGGDLSDLDVVHSIMGRLKKRISLAQEIDGMRHRERKEVADDNWVKKMADEAEIALDEDDVDPDADHAVGTKTHKKQQSRVAANIRALQDELREELRRTLLVRGVKRKFITQGVGLDLGEHANGKDALRGLVDGTGHNTFLGLGRTTASSDLNGKGKATSASASASTGVKDKSKKRKAKA